MARLNPAQSLGVRWLFFRLRNGQSISPARLMSVWSEAAESNDCAVRREIIDGAGYVYALYAPNSLLSPRRVERRATPSRWVAWQGVTPATVEARR